MPNKMLIDAAHPEETRVVVLRGSRVEEFDFESASRKQLRGNIYLAKVTRVEPSLQAAFVDYGGNRHGFLAFSEIHPDYYQIPVADRQALIEAEEAEIAEAEARQAERDRQRGGREQTPAEARAAEAEEAAISGPASESSDEEAQDEPAGEADTSDLIAIDGGEPATASDEEPVVEIPSSDAGPSGASAGEATSLESSGNGHGDDGHVVSDDAVESVGAEDALEELPERRKPRARQYKIQEVIKRRQVLLVQVVKEERGNKGAALTTYLSLAGRYCVLMPNTARGGGISRKITSLADRKRLKQVVSDLEVPTGMGVILRTAGASRTRAEVKRDFEYLLRLWETVRELTLKSTAPMLVYEEGSLIKRSIRDLYNKDIDEVIVAGDDSYREAKDFMRMLMPSHAKNVKPYKEPQPLFARSGIEAQLDAMFSPQVTLRSGGYLVINQTEALVSIDVNSGRSTREHNIEDTALQTNLEAAEEVARQLRLRDLAGLIVIDFIDMEEKRNNRSVERKLKDALKNDRARIQVGRISHFGLLEMSRQRIRTGVLESTTTVCPTCQGTGHVRAPASVALHVLRQLEDLLLKGATHNLTIRTRTVVALYILNQKRATLSEIEQRFGITITVAADETIANGAHFTIERGEPVERRENAPALIAPASVQPIVDDVEAGDLIVEAEAEPESEDVEIAAEDHDGHRQHHDHEGEQGQERGEGRRRRRRRGRGRGGDRERGEPASSGNGARPAPAQFEPSQGVEGADAGLGAADDDDAFGAEHEVEAANGNGSEFGGGDAQSQLGPDGQPRKRRRGRRGGRRGRRGRGGENRPFEANREDSGQRAPAAFGNADFSGAPFGGIEAPYDEVDTTPTLEPRRAVEPPRRLDFASDDLMSDEIDTTPQVEPAPRPAEAAQAPVPEQKRQPEPKPHVETEAEISRPKRSGWWQRKSFF